MKFELHIDSDNAAMKLPYDVAIALSKVAGSLRRYTNPDEFHEIIHRRIHDDNGNTVGRWEYKA